MNIGNGRDSLLFLITETLLTHFTTDWSSPVGKLTNLLTELQIFSILCLQVQALQRKSSQKKQRSSCELVHQFVPKCSETCLHFPGTFYLNLPLTHIPAGTFDAKTIKKERRKDWLFFFLYPSYNLTAAPTGVIKCLRRGNAIRKTSMQNSGLLLIESGCC